MKKRSKLKTSLQKILRMRKYLLNAQKSGKNYLRSWNTLNRIQQHLEAYPNLSDKQLSRYIIKHMDEIEFLAPSSTSGDTLLAELHQSLNSISS